MEVKPEHPEDVVKLEGGLKSEMDNLTDVLESKMSDLLHTYRVLASEFSRLEMYDDEAIEAHELIVANFILSAFHNEMSNLNLTVERSAKVFAEALSKSGFEPTFDNQPHLKCIEWSKD